MPRCKDEAPAVRVYTVCDESRSQIVFSCQNKFCHLCDSSHHISIKQNHVNKPIYQFTIFQINIIVGIQFDFVKRIGGCRYLIVKNVPALGCGDDLLKLFSSYGEVEEYVISFKQLLQRFTLLVLHC